MPGAVTIYVDEAGTADFSSGSSKTLVIGYVYAIKPARVSCDVKKLRHRLNKNYRLNAPEFKFHDDSDRVKRMFMKQISKMNIFCGYVAINKNAPNSHFRNNPDRLYHYLTVHYPIKRVVHELKPDVIEYILDRQSWSRERRDNFDAYVRNKAEWVSMVECGKGCPDIRPKHENSRLNPCLQVADYVSSSVFRACERGDDRYYSMIKGKFKDGWIDTWGPVGL